MRHTLKHLLFGLVLGFLAFGCCMQRISTEPKVSLNLNRIAVKLEINAIDMGASLIASGFAVDNKHIVTAGHYCAEIEKAEVDGIKTDGVSLIFVDNRRKLSNVGFLEIVKIDEELDLCLLEMERHGIVPAILDVDFEYLIGEEVLAVGAPMGWFPVETKGKIIKDESDIEFALSAASARGNSGCPIFNESGQVVGMITKVHKFYHNITFAVKASTIKKFLEDE